MDKPTPEQKLLIQNNEWFRAGGECVCVVCSKLYREHKVIQVDENFHLNVLCDGNLVKL